MFVSRSLIYWRWRRTPNRQFRGGNSIGCETCNIQSIAWTCHICQCFLWMFSVDNVTIQIILAMEFHVQYSEVQVCASSLKMLLNYGHRLREVFCSQWIKESYLTKLFHVSQVNAIEWSLLSRARLKKVKGKPSNPAFTGRIVLMLAILTFV